MIDLDNQPLTGERLCLNCSRPIRGRVDKKYCDDSCRNSYNNQVKSVNNNLIRNINNSLRKNRTILESIVPDSEGVARVQRDKLLREGFNFKYHTHTYTNRKGSTYHYCYDYGFLPLENDWYLVVRDKED